MSLKFKKGLRTYFLFIYSIILLTSCKSFRQNIMLVPEQEDLTLAAEAMEKDYLENYQIKPNDWLRVDIFTHNGERLIDPDNMLGQVNRGIQNNNQNQNFFRYLVQSNGEVKLPVIGLVQVEGLTIYEAEAKLQELYNTYYKETFVMVRYLNKRVIVLGAMGGHVIPLENENTNLLEALALAGGLTNDAKAHNIRLIRGNLQQPQVFLIDLSTIKGMKEANLLLESGDVVYVEPRIRPLQESIREITPIFSLITSVISLVALFRTI